MSGSRGRSTYSFRIQAEGFQEFVGDLRKLGGESEAAQRAIDTLVRSSPQLASSLDAAAQATERAAKRATELREAQERAAASAVTAGGRMTALSGTLNDLEGRTQAARRAAGDFRGVLDLLGATGVSRTIGDVSKVVDGVADAMSVGSLATGRFGGALGMLGGVGGPLLLVTAGITAGVAVWQNWSTIVGVTGRALGDVGIELGIFQRQHELTSTALQSSTGWFESYSAALRKARGDVEDLAKAEFDRLRVTNTQARQALWVERGRFEDRLGPVGQQLAAAEMERGDLLGRMTGGTDGLERHRLLRLAELDNQILSGQAEIARLRAGLSTREAELARLDDALVTLQIQGPNAFRRGSAPDPYAPGGRYAPAASGRAPADTSARDAAELERDFERAERLARRAAQSAIDADTRAQATITRAREREEAARERAAERTTDSITRYLADGFADTLRGMEGGFAGTMRALQRTAASTVIRFGAEALIRPVVSAGVSALGMGSDTGGSVSQLLGFAGAANQASSLLGIGGGGGLAGLANTPLWGGNVAGPAFNGIAASGAPTLGALAGGIGGGFALGSIIGGFTAGDSAARQQNAQIGAGGGALAGAAIGSIVPGIGTVIGGLIGGALGGGGGGLLGPGQKTNAYSFEVSAANGGFSADRLRTTGTGGDGAALLAQTQQQLAQINATLAAAGLSVVDARRGIAGGAPISPGQFSDLGSALTTFEYRSANDNVNRALASRPGAGVDEAVAISQFVTTTYESMSSLATPANAFRQALDGITSVFGPLITQARDLSLATEGLVANQAKQIEALNRQRQDASSQLSGSITSQYYRAVGMNEEAALFDFDAAAPRALEALREALLALDNTAEDTAREVARLAEVQGVQRENIIRDAERVAQAERERAAAERERAAAEAAAAQRARVEASRGLYEQLAFGDLGGLSPEARRQAAGLALDNARNALLDGATTQEVAEFGRVAQATLPVIRDFEGISPAFAGVVRLVNDTLREFSPEGDSGGLAALINIQVEGNGQIVSALRGNADALESLAQRFDRLASEVRSIVAKKA